MSFKYGRYIARVTRQPWAITPEKFEVLADLLRFRASGNRLSDEEIAERLQDEAHARADIAAAMQAASGGQGAAVAVVPVHGTIAHRADSFEASSGGCSCERVGRHLKTLAGDDNVASVLLDFDTPGGSVEGVPELAAQIAKLAAVKPVVAHVNALAASAGYWLASQCSEIVVTPSGMVGSIGVFMLMVDRSEMLAKEGIKVNAISAGEHKLEGAPWEPMSDETRTFYQAQVDDVYGQFLKAVAKGRGVTVAEVKESYGQGRVFDAKEAIARGMVDRIATMDDTLARLMSGRVSAGLVKAKPVAPLKPEQYMGDPQGQEQVETVEPEDGECPEDYEMGEDGMCHLMPKDAKADADPKSRASLDAQQAEFEAEARQPAADLLVVAPAPPASDEVAIIASSIAR